MYFTNGVFYFAIRAGRLRTLASHFTCPLSSISEKQAKSKLSGKGRASSSISRGEYLPREEVKTWETSNLSFLLGFTAETWF